MCITLKLRDITKEEAYNRRGGYNGYQGHFNVGNGNFSTGRGMMFNANPRGFANGAHGFGRGQLMHINLIDQPHMIETFLMQSLVLKMDLEITYQYVKFITNLDTLQMFVGIDLKIMCLNLEILKEEKVKGQHIW